MAEINNDQLLTDQFDLEEKLLEVESKESRKLLIFEYLQKRNVSQGSVLDLLFSGCEWLNVNKNVEKSHLQGKIVILDFFTYCCINCMHILPTLHKIEEKYKEAGNLAVLGIHSAKFENEKSSKNIENAILRYGIGHPVLNDEDAVLWNQFSIQCWPTIVLIGPKGNILFQLIGESTEEKLLELCNTIDEYYVSDMKTEPYSDVIIPLKASSNGSLLRYPGKVSMSANNKWLAISDSGRNRILIIDYCNSTIKHRIGSPEPGNVDGNFDDAKFNSPQGTAWYSEEVLYVADTENHTIRMIDLGNELVSTVCGTGVQGNDTEGGDIGCSQSISSPWDLTFSSQVKDVLFVAMAGTHQVWIFAVEDVAWIDKKIYEKGTCKAFVGSGAEGNRNNSYPQSATLAQPSGITASKDHPMLYFADSESSSIRSISLERGCVKAVVGGNRDPTNLFSFGDTDGQGFDAKLQHPLGVTFNDKDNFLYVADSYNHKIKLVNIDSRDCATIKCENLNEPGGLCTAENGNVLLVADTNNHRILKINANSKTSTEVTINPSIGQDQYDSKKHDFIIRHDPISIKNKDQIQLEICILETDATQLNLEAPNRWRLDLQGDLQVVPEQKTDGNIRKIKEVLEIKFCSGIDGCLHLETNLFGCDMQKGSCFMISILHVVPICDNGKYSDVLELNCCLQENNIDLVR